MRIQASILTAVLCGIAAAPAVPSTPTANHDHELDPGERGFWPKPIPPPPPPPDPDPGEGCPSYCMFVPGIPACICPLGPALTVDDEMRTSDELNL